MRLIFDVYSTFGKRVVAKGSVPPETFRTRLTSSGYHHLALFDPRLRPVGGMSFKFQVIRPFSGVGLDITPFATYWKATSQFDSKPNSLVTGTSLSGSYLRVYVQLSRDGVPIVYPDWLFDHHGLNIPVIGLTYREFTRMGGSSSDEASEALAHEVREQSLEYMHKTLASSHMSLYDVLESLPSHVHVEIHVLYPSEEEEESLRLGPTPNINDFVDSLLTEVFKHARDCRRESGGKFMRSIVFTSYNGDLCTALNWKQPNCKCSIGAVVL